ncbi:MAG: hypothetical protein ACYDH0_06675 [Candidatus Aminicenantales bacterium]
MGVETSGGRSGRRGFFPACAVLLVSIAFSACVSHLERAKLHYSEAGWHVRAYETALAAASFKTALFEAERAIRAKPSAQAYMLKGMAEAGLEKWAEAEESFLRGFALGFPEGQEWAADVSMLGLASSLDELGIREAALRSLSTLLQKGKFKPARLEAARRYTDLSLALSAGAAEKERTRVLEGVVRTIEKLIDAEYSCGYYHYLLSQVESHLKDYRKSFEEAVMAREFGLPSDKTLRDNDLQILFIRAKMKETQPPDQWAEFDILYEKWIVRWGWTDSLTPDWRKE